MENRGDRVADQQVVTSPTLIGLRKRSVPMVLLAVIAASIALLMGRPSAVPTERETILSREEAVSRRVVQPGDFLPTRAGELATWTLLEGFLHPERDGTWMAQLSARMDFTVDGNATPLSILIDVEPLLAASVRERDLTVSSSIDEVTVTLTGGRRSILVALDGRARQQITLECSAVDAPIELEVGPDRRAFCAKLFGFEVAAE